MKCVNQLIFFISATSFCPELESPRYEQPTSGFNAEIKYTSEQNQICEPLVFQAGYEIVKVGLQYGLYLKSLNATNIDEKNVNLLRPSALYIVCQQAKSQQNDLSFILLNDGKNDVFRDIKTIKEKRIPVGWKQGSITIQRVTSKWISELPKK